MSSCRATNAKEWERPTLTEAEASAVLYEYPDADLSAFRILSFKTEDELAMEAAERVGSVLAARGRAKKTTKRRAKR